MENRTMKGMLKKFVALAATALFWSSQANAVIIEFVPSTLGPLTGGTDVSVEVRASDLGGDVVSSFDILVNYDSTLLTNFSILHSQEFCFYDCNPLSPTSDYLFGGDPIFGVGQTNWSILSFLWNDELAWVQNGVSVLLFTMDFHVLADARATDLSFTWNDQYDVKCANPDDPFDLYVCSPTEVPEPGTLALLGLGLLGMAVSRRRQKIKI